MNYKTLFWKMIAVVISLLGVIAIFIIVVDPYFHYHAPYENMHYRLTDERYINSGVVKNFEYDTLITGTSMTENFLTSECDELFGVTSIKAPLRGATYYEINNLVEYALKENPNLKVVFRGLDSTGIVVDKNERSYTEEQWPEYLYDDNLLNDIQYLLNVEVLKQAIINCGMTILDIPSMTFDEYANWNNDFEYSKEITLSNHKRMQAVGETYQLTEEERQIVLENIKQNVTAVAAEYPDVTFYYFITPASILYWDKLSQLGKLDWYIEAERIAIEEMLQYDNIKLFSFCSHVDIVENLSYYKDIAHYWGKTNSNLLKQMKSNNFRLTADNYEEYIDFLHQTYCNYDYESIYQ